MRTDFSLETSRSRDSAAVIATAYAMDEREAGVQVPVGSKIFSSKCRGPPSEQQRFFLQE
jgi:hypothetical protein